MNDKKIIKEILGPFKGAKPIPNSIAYRMMLAIAQKARQDEREKCKDINVYPDLFDEIRKIRSENADLKARWEKLKGWADSPFGSNRLIFVLRKMQELESKKEGK
jgi:hypothetical protein